MGHFDIAQFVEKYRNYPPEEISIKIVSVDLQSEDVVLVLHLTFDDAEEPGQRWEIRMKECVDTQLSSEISHEIHILNDHPLLWDFSNRFSSLYFKGVPDDLFRLYFDLNTQLEALYGPFQIKGRLHLNHERSFDKLFMAGGGLFAKGPIKLIEILNQYLLGQNLTTSLIDSGNPYFLCGGRMMSGPKDYLVLHLGNSYFIAKEFTLEIMFV